MAAPASAPAPELEEGYYLEGFETVADFARERCAELLSDEERSWLERFAALPLPSRRLWVRLASRKGPLFVVSELDYPEVGDIAQAMAPLVEGSFVVADPPVSLEEAFHTFDKAKLFAALGRPEEKRLGKAALLRALAARGVGEDLREHFEFALVRLDAKDWVRRLCFMFFGHGWRGLEQFVLRDLGLQRREPYTVDPDARIFSSRGEVDRAMALEALHARLATSRHLDGADEVASFLELLREPFAAAFLEHRRQGALIELGREYERLKRLESALGVFESVERPPARERRARVLHRLGRVHRAKVLCDEMLADPRDEPEALFAAAFRRRLSGLKRRAHPRLPEVTLALPPGQTRVELRALAHYETQGWRGAWVENALVNAVLGLLAWDVFFDPGPPGTNVFVHEFQNAPLDLHTPAFRTRCGAALDAAVSGFDPASVLARAREKRGVGHALVHWERISDELLALALRRIPREHWRVLLRRAASDSSDRGSGLPDLVLFDEDRATYRFVEVKGPGDRLSPHQRRWIEFMVAQGVPVEVAQVVDVEPRSG